MYHSICTSIGFIYLHRERKEKKDLVRWIEKRETAREQEKKKRGEEERDIGLKRER